jgi:hypothetical protein
MRRGRQRWSGRAGKPSGARAVAGSISVPLPFPLPLSRAKTSADSRANDPARLLISLCRAVVRRGARRERLPYKRSQAVDWRHGFSG